MTRTVFGYLIFIIFRRFFYSTTFFRCRLSFSSCCRRSPTATVHKHSHYSGTWCAHFLSLALTSPTSFLYFFVSQHIHTHKHQHSCSFASLLIHIRHTTLAFSLTHIWHKPQSKTLIVCPDTPRLLSFVLFLAYLTFISNWLWSHSLSRFDSIQTSQHIRHTCLKFIAFEAYVQFFVLLHFLDFSSSPALSLSSSNRHRQARASHPTVAAQSPISSKSSSGGLSLYETFTFASSSSAHWLTQNSQVSITKRPHRLRRHHHRSLSLSNIVITIIITLFRDSLSLA